MRYRSACSLREKLPYGEGDLPHVRFKCEVSCIQKLDSRVWVISPVSLCAWGDKERIVIVSEMILLLRSEANEHAVSIRTDLAADLPKITADRVQLQQVLMNLMLNGIEAMNETGGVLTVTTKRGEGCQVLISVSDTGVGLPAGRADEIFNAFFTTKPLGSGMGLAISRSIAEAHGGRLWANGDSRPGATFHFTLPAAPAKTCPPVEAA
jgi:signal transduction histidine kinase